MFWGFTGEIFAYKANFVDSSLPAFAFSFTRSNNFEHFCLGHWLDFFDRDIPFASLFFTFLFDHVGQDFRVLLLLSVHQIGGDSAILDGFCFTLGILFLVSLDGLLHLYFLLESLFVKDLGLDAA